MKILVFGSDLVTLGSLQHLKQCSAVSQLEVVTPFTKKTNTIGPISWCHENNIKYHCLPKDTDFRMKNWNIPSTLSSCEDDILSNEWDVGIVVSFGHLIPPRIINSFKFGMLNMHPSLLPQ